MVTSSTLMLGACSRPGRSNTPASGTPTSTTSPAAPGQAAGRSRVAVIGAGMAGLACAAHLCARGIEVVVLEARDRIGGRIHTSHAWRDVPIDLGASWIHGRTGNPIADLARRARARTVSTSYDSAELYIAPGLRAAGFHRPDTARWEDLVGEAARMAERADRDVSLDTAIGSALDGEALTATERVDLAFYLHATYEAECGLDVARISARTADDGKSFGGEDVLFPDGCEAIPAHLARGVDIRTGEQVHQIRHGEAGATVVTGAREHAVAAVVLTVPLAVLRHGTIAVSPDLPAASRAALEVISVGVLGKTFLRFPSAFWPAAVDWHEYVAPENRWTEWVSLAKTGPPVLLGFSVGDHARWTESAPERDVVEQAMAAVRAMFGVTVPSPVAVQRSTWAADPLARGSYTSNGVGTTRDHRVTLAQPQGARLVLAGEATEPDYFGTVHGAYLSGIRAAEQVRRVLGQ